MKLEHGKKYVTQGGWIVEIIVVSNNGSQHYFITQKTSPGVSLIHGKTAVEYAKSNFATWAQHCGWQYTTDGQKLYQHLQGIDPRDFRIVAEYPCEIDPPQGYVWAGVFPKVEEPVHDRIYLTSDGRACKCQNVENAFVGSNTCWVNIQGGIGKHRILLQPAAAVPKPEHSVTEGEQYYIPTKKYTWDVQNKYFVKKGDQWYGWSPRVKEEVREARDEYWQGLIKDGVIVSCTREQAMERVLLSKQEAAESPQAEQYYVPTDMYTGEQKRYFVKRQGVWYNWNIGTQKEYIDGSGEAFWKNFIAEGKIKPSTKEEAMARVGVATSPKPADEMYYLPNGIVSSAKYFTKKDGKWFYYDGFSGKEIRSNYDNDYWVGQITRGGIMECTKPQAMVAATPPTFGPPVVATNSVVSIPVTKEEKMNSSTFVNLVKSAASRTLGAANHFYVEPAKIIGGYVKRSVRYAVFFGTLTGIVYGVNDPASLKKRVASCMPKITIEAPDALK